MTAEEIVRHWQQAKKRDAAELQLLAELNTTGKDAIRKILQEAGETVPQERLRRQRNEALYKTIESLYSQHLSDTEIARRAECSRPTVTRWRKENGLPGNTEPGRPAAGREDKAPAALPAIYSQMEALLASLPAEASGAVRRRAGDLLADMFGEYLVERLRLREEETT